ncbi:hypothetical protein SO802_034210 [Lithocarpus litseifolius]|uniref:Reverse transcriptase domain-containing protein n=1 Tax=Lithocarpus litseifolius TaxID=425828 RepID=A0AAW2BIJ0_9ROSI
MPVDINATHICLIPKKNNPQKITDYRLISLSNVLSRIVSKVLANRLKKVLPNIISTSQSAFLSDRLITDNIPPHQPATERQGRPHGNQTRHDKVFDRVKWPCLEMIMRKLGFHERWISFTMICVKTATYSILINGELKGSIRPSKGILQGDLISPYLFLICVEGISAMLNRG